MSSNGKVVVVSGGSRGLGSALVDNLLESGHSVATFSRSRTPFIEKCQKMKNASRFFFWQELDGTDFDNFKPFVNDVVKCFGRIDVLINNAGIGDDGILTLMRPSDIHKVISLNYEAVILLTQACAKVMLQQESGNIINISSVHGIRGHKGVSVYSSTKAALNGFTRSLARELGPRSIRVNSVAPGYFETDMAAALTSDQKEQIRRKTPLKRLGSVDDIVFAVRFLISADSSFITGQTLIVDGGITC